MNAAASLKALIADDEPLLRDRLQSHLARLWPELAVVAQARNGREAVELFDLHSPDVVFLDVHMPGVNGIEAARSVARRAQIVFVTAHEQYAVQAFEHGAIDYLVKPFDEARLADTVERLKQRFALAREPSRTVSADTSLQNEEVSSAARLEAVLDQLAAELKQRGSAGRPASYLQWFRASVGSSVRLIPVEQVIYLRADEKYTLIVWEGGEALIRKTIRELADELDPECFVQIHRSTIVSLRQIAQVNRGPNETAEVQIKGRKELLPVSRSFVHVFRQM
ncbi:LytTR family DNA-binding domain-containing protein [soil metagenome]